MSRADPFWTVLLGDGQGCVGRFADKTTAKRAVGALHDRGYPTKQAIPLHTDLTTVSRAQATTKRKEPT